MARKQTLKQLLGQNGDREQVDLDLSPTQLTPTVRGGGNYGIAGPRVVTNQTLSQLTSALGKVNPILKEYKEAKFNEEKANVVNAEADILKFQQEWDGLSDKEREDFTKQQITSRDDAERSINKMFRGNYEMNPIALVRAQKVIGASFINELTEGEQDDFNVFLDKRDPLQGAITAEDLREFFQARDEEFIEKNPWLNNSPLAMDGFNSKLRERRLRNQKTMLIQGRTHYKENVLYPHVGKSLTQTLVNPPLDEDSNPDITKLVAELNEEWKSTDALTFNETKKLMLNWVESVSFEDSEKIYSLLPELSKLKIGNSTIGNTPEVYNIIEETLFQRQEAFEKRIEDEQKKTVTEEYDDYINNQNTILTATLPEGVSNRYEYSEQLAHQRRQKLTANMDDYTPKQISIALDLISAGQANANSLISTAIHSVAEAVGVRQGYFEETLPLKVSEIETALNAEAKGGFKYSFYDFEELPDGTKSVSFRADIEKALDNLSLQFEMNRREALVNSSVFPTISERVNAYKTAVVELETQFEALVKETLVNSSKLDSVEETTPDVRNDEFYVMDIEENPLTKDIPMFIKSPKAGIVYGKDELQSFTDANKHIFEVIKLDDASVVTGKGSEEDTQNLLDLTRPYRAVTSQLKNSFDQIKAKVDKRFNYYENKPRRRRGVRPKIHAHEHAIYSGSLGAIGLSFEDINNLDFIPRVAGSIGDDISEVSVFRNPQGFRIRSRKFIQQMQEGLIPITDYANLSEENKKALAERFDVDFEVFDRRQKILGKLRGQ